MAEFSRLRKEGEKALGVVVKGIEERREGSREQGEPCQLSCPLPILFEELTASAVCRTPPPSDHVSNPNLPQRPHRISPSILVGHSSPCTSGQQ